MQQNYVCLEPTCSPNEGLYHSLYAAKLNSPRNCNQLSSHLLFYPKSMVLHSNMSILHRRGTSPDCQVPPSQILCFFLSPLPPNPWALLRLQLIQHTHIHAFQLTSVLTPSTFITNSTLLLLSSCSC